MGIKLLPIIFQPDLLWQNDLVLGETLVSLKPRKTLIISLRISNPTNNSLILYPKTNLGTIQQTSAVIPIEIKNLLNCQPKTQTWWNSKLRLPGVDLSHLPVDRREKVKQVSFSECNVLVKDENDVGKIDSLKLKLKVIESRYNQCGLT